jgi:hypothetical protein
VFFPNDHLLVLQMVPIVLIKPPELQTNVEQVPFHTSFSCGKEMSDDEMKNKTWWIPFDKHRSNRNSRNHIRVRIVLPRYHGNSRDRKHRHRALLCNCLLPYYAYDRWFHSQNNFVRNDCSVCMYLEWWECVRILFLSNTNQNKRVALHKVRRSHHYQNRCHRVDRRQWDIDGFVSGYRCYTCLNMERPCNYSMNRMGMAREHNSSFEFVV